MRTTINGKIIQAKNSIENALHHPEILKKLTAYSYDRKKLQEGKALNEKTYMLQLAKQEKYGSQFESTDTLEADVAVAKAIYNEHVALARLVFKNQRGMQVTLQISGRRKYSREEWLAQAMSFYSRTEEIGDAMSKYGVTPEVLNQSKAMIEALFTSRQQQLQRIGEAQDATEKRDEALKAMEVWMKEYRMAARLALKDSPQLLEILGIKVPTRVK